MSDKPYIPLSELRDMWQRAEDDAAPWGAGAKGTRIYFRGAVEERVKRINEIERIAQLEAENASLRERLAARDNVQGALNNAAWELSTWAASINWNGAQTSAWYQGLEKRIVDVQGLCRITKGADNE